MDIISVILTTYNSAQFLTRTLDSILGQKGINESFGIELIVVDDYSTDDTQEILKRYHIDFILPPSKIGGPNAGRNIGLKIASGNYICIMDHDDEWHPDKTIKQLPLLKKVPIVSCGYTIFDSHQQKKIDKSNKSTSANLFYDTNETFLQKLTKQHNGQQAYLAGIIYDASLKDICFEEHFNLSDYDWFLKLFHNNPSAEVCECLYNRYVKSDNLSLDKRFVILDFYYSLLTIEDYSTLYPKETKLAYHRIHGTRARYHYIYNEMDKARFYFLKSGLNWKSVLYYLTTFAGSGLVKKYFNVFG
jgi:glycosyltransferase involved in cell wall biosynthesis